MMKSTLATILGTAIVGLLKEKLGSTLRLSKKNVSVLFSENRFYADYNDIPFEENVVIQSSVPGIREIELMFLEDGSLGDISFTFYELSIKFDELYSDVYETYEIIEDNIYNIMMEAWSAFEIIYNNSGSTPEGSYLRTENGVKYRFNQKHLLSEDLKDPNFDPLSFFINSELMDGYSEIVIDEDTGKTYTPKKAKSPKLRKR